MANWLTSELKDFLDLKAEQYETPEFLDSDPLGVVHQASSSGDKELFGFIVALIAWGNRKSIIRNAHDVLHRLDHCPYRFILDASPKEIQSASKGFVHRTFNAQDLEFLLLRFQDFYHSNSSLSFFFEGDEKNLHQGIERLRAFILEVPHEKRFEKHIASPMKGSVAKRIHLYLRWMVRSPIKGVDFGIWPNVKPSQLSLPLDVHTSRVARKLGLISRKQDDIKTLIELDQTLRNMEQEDPIKYDFALFGLGVHEDF